MLIDYLTIPEASAFSGKPEITIRRLIKRLKNKGVKKETKGKRFIYKISKEILIDEYKLSETKADSNSQKKAETDGSGEKKNENLSAIEKTIAILQAQLEAKDRQLEKMQELVRNQQVLSLQQPRKKSFWQAVFGKKND